MFGFRHNVKKESSGTSRDSPNSDGGGRHHDDGGVRSQLAEARLALREAEAKILSLERSRDGDTHRLWELKERLNGVQVQREREASLLRMDVRQLRSERDAEKERTLALERELRDESRMGEYAALVEEVVVVAVAAGGASSSSSLSLDGIHDPQHRTADDARDDANGAAETIAQLKRHLTRALHRMEVLSNRGASIQSSCDRLLRKMRDEFSRELDAKSQEEAKIINQLAVHQLEREDLEEQRREERERHEREVRELEKRVEELEGRLKQQRLQEEGTAARLDGNDHDRVSTNTVLDNGADAAAVAEASTKSLPAHLNASSDRSRLLEEQLQHALRSKDEMEAEFRREAADRDRMIAWLEEENYVKDRLLRKLQRGEGGGGSSVASSSSSARGGSAAGSTTGSFAAVMSSSSSRQCSGSGNDNDDGDLSAGDLGRRESAGSGSLASSLSPTLSSTGMSHPPAAAWMNPLDASLMGMSLNVMPPVVATTEEKEKERDHENDEGEGAGNIKDDGPNGASIDLGMLTL